MSPPCRSLCLRSSCCHKFPLGGLAATIVCFARKSILRPWDSFSLLSCGKLWLACQWHKLKMISMQRTKTWMRHCVVSTILRPKQAGRREGTSDSEVEFETTPRSIITATRMPKRRKSMPRGTTHEDSERSQRIIDNVPTFSNNPWETRTTTERRIIRNETTAFEWKSQYPWIEATRGFLRVPSKMATLERKPARLPRACTITRAKGTFERERTTRERGKATEWSLLPILQAALLLIQKRRLPRHLHLLECRVSRRLSHLAWLLLHR